MTIEERAKINAVKAIEYACGARTGNPNYITNLFIEIATEQKEVDDALMVEEREKAFKTGYDIAMKEAYEWLRKEIPNYLGLFTSHFEDDNDVEQVVVKACINSQIYEDFKKAMEE